jgi:7,8-dihydroneopterin 2',3'-cyclic phosphate phosphodiesterase
MKIRGIFMRKSQRLENLIKLIKDKNLRNKVSEIVHNPQIEIDGIVYSGLPLEDSPAGLTRHHNYPGGLVEHVVSATKIALLLCDVVEAIYEGQVDRDLVIAGILLHDIFKPLTYEQEIESYSITTLGERVDHLTIAVAELIRKNFSLDLVHVVCAHHGGQAGPMWPRTVEALICHLADYVDSQLNGEVLRAARYLSRRATGEELSHLRSKEAFEIVNSKKLEGWQGVKDTMEKIKRERHK